MAEAGPRWMALESNPEAMNKFLRSLGIPDPVHFVDVFGFDDDLLAFIPQPVYALLFVFPSFEKYHAEAKKVYEKLKSEGATVPKDMFFMEQHIGNACGTYALFHSLANNGDNFDLGKGPFRAFYDKAKGLSPTERSKVLAEDNTLASAHKECANLGETEAKDKVDHHFICYIQKDGKLYEIDSTAPFPRCHGGATKESFVKEAGKQCVAFMKNFPENVSFSAIALVGGAK